MHTSLLVTLLISSIILSNVSVLSAAKATPTPSSCYEHYGCPANIPASVCTCPSQLPPANLKPKDIPQFILLTHDDYVNTYTVAAMNRLTNLQPPPRLTHLALDNDGTILITTTGCPLLPVTWFVASQGSDCDVIHQLWSKGDEMGVHTYNHIELKPNMKITDVQKEIINSRKFLTTTCAIPKDDVVGFRSPFLITNPAVRAVLYAEKFLYDSSVMNHRAEEANQRPFPFTLHGGVPHMYCDGIFQYCKISERYPELWEIPVSSLKYDKQNYEMDPGKEVAGEWGAESRSVYKVMKANFDAAYNGNRAPLPFFVHNHWFTNETVAEGQTFIRYALSQPNVYFVTMKTLIQWMIQPVKSEDMPAWLKSQYKHLHTTKTQTKAYKGKPPPSASDSQLEEAKGQNPQVGVDVYRQQALSSSRNVAFLLLSFLCLQSIMCFVQRRKFRVHRRR